MNRLFKFTDKPSYHNGPELQNLSIALLQGRIPFNISEVENNIDLKDILSYKLNDSFIYQGDNFVIIQLTPLSHYVFSTKPSLYQTPPQKI